MEPGKEDAESLTHFRTANVTLRRRIMTFLQRHAALPYFLASYWRSSKKLESSNPRNDLFADFLRQTSGPCLQISVKDEFSRKFGDNWVSVDRYDHSPVIDRHDDITDLRFPENHFNAAVCLSVLEHVPDPHRAIAEMLRVLKPGGSIWVQVPFLFPYHADPDDYWRVTPQGLRLWMREFEEIACGADYWSKTSIVAGTFFWGLKPPN